VLNSTECGVSQSPVSDFASSSCLIVDDSPMVRRIARKALASLGLEIDDAENGQIALDKCQNRMPDIVLLDWNMPVMDGLEFLEALRRTDGGSAPIVVFCTTETDVEHIQKAIQSGADEYVMKPFDRDSLCSKVSLAVQARQR
jgi:two-component system, chemotaxis family, chemotaxis protein CheY